MILAMSETEIKTVMTEIRREAVMSKGSTSIRGKEYRKIVLRNAYFFSADSWVY